MQEVSLFCFVDNALLRIKAHLYENIDRFHTVEEAIALAERYEVGRSGGVISKFSINAFQEHMNPTQNDYNNTNTDDNISSQLVEQTQDELDHQYGDQSYDGQINAINRNPRRGGRRNTRPWGRGRGNSGGGSFRVPVAPNPVGGAGLGNYYNANDPTTTKKNLLCYRCGSAAHVVKDCHYPPMTADNPKNFAARRGKVWTFQRREKFNSLGVYMSTEDVPIYYYSENDRIEELPNSTPEDAEGYDERGEINVLNENKFGNLDYLGVVEDEINIESYFQNNAQRREI